jgi:uncharacterized protein YjbI with pentapeptide repeats
MTGYTSLSYAGFIKKIKSGEKDFSRAVISAPKSKKAKNKSDKNLFSLSGISFQGTVFPKDFAFFRGRCLENCNFDYAVLNEVSFAKTLLKGKCSFNRASLQKADFRMVKAEKETSFAYADLRFADMRGADCQEVAFTCANLNEARFSPKSNFDRADFRSCSLCFLRKANLASWQGAVLSDALINKNRAADRFKGANLDEARSSGQMNKAARKIYLSMIANAFEIKGTSFHQKSGTEKKIAEYALNALDKIGLRYSAPVADKKGLLAFRLTSKSTKTQTVLKELQSKIKESESQSNNSILKSNIAVADKIKGQSR